MSDTQDTMQNYSDIRELLDTTEGMTVIRNNSKNDDSTDTVKGVDWFHFNGVVANNLYVSGNMWVGFGANSEQLKVWRRDTNVYYIYRQEAKCHGTRFLKLRVHGYGHYSSTDRSALIVYELFLLEDGRIFLYMVTEPSLTSYSATHQLLCGSEQITIPLTGAAPESFTFTPADAESGKQWGMENSIPILATYRFLCKSGDSFYTVEDGALVPLESVTALTQEVFLTHGIPEPPPSDLLVTLPSPTIYEWTDASQISEMRAQISATPKDQPIVAVCDMSHESVLGILSLSAVASDTVGVCLSYDGGSTFSEEQPMSGFIQTDPTTIWEALPGDRKLVFRFVLHDEDSLTNFAFKFENPQKEEEE